MSNELKENTVQHTLCMPLCGRMIAARKYSDLFPDRDAERIVRNLGQDISGRPCTACNICGSTARIGTPEELMKQNGVFVRMIRLQTKSQNWMLT